MPGYRFIPRNDVFKMDFEKYPQNKCFCDGEELCEIIGDGMFAVPKCQFKAPIILSWPHFLHVNETFKNNMVSGNYYIYIFLTIYQMNVLTSLLILRTTKIYVLKFGLFEKHT